MDEQELKEYEELKDLVENDGIWEEIRDRVSDLVETNIELEKHCNR